MGLITSAIPLIPKMVSAGQNLLNTYKIDTAVKKANTTPFQPQTIKDFSGNSIPNPAYVPPKPSVISAPTQTMTTNGQTYGVKSAEVPFTPTAPVVATTTTKPTATINKVSTPLAVAPVTPAAPVQKMDTGMAADLAKYNASVAAQKQTNLAGTGQNLVPPTGSTNTPPTGDQTGTTGTTPPPTGTAGTTPSSILGMYGVTGSQPKDLASLYGGTTPEYKAPDTKTSQSLIDKYAPVYSPEATQAQLNSELENIRARYDIQRQQAEKKTEGERMNQISNLYSLGVVNPASSGVSSIGVASNDILNQRMDQISANEAAEMDIAKAKAYDRSTKEQEKALAFAQEQQKNLETKAQDQYTRDRQLLADKVSMVQNVVDAFKSGKTTAKEDKQTAQDSLKDLISTYGSSYFDGMTVEEINNMSQATGLSKEGLMKGLQNLKTKEIEANKNKQNAFTIEKGDDGSLYAVYTNKTNPDGTAKFEKIVQGTKSTEFKTYKVNGEDYILDANGNLVKPELPSAPTAEKVAKADEVITQIDNILNNPNLSKAIGPVSSNVPEFLRSGARNDVDAAINQLIAGVAIENLSLLKGPMSDKDVQFIKQASSGLNTNMSEQGFKARLQQLKDKFTEIKSKAASGITEVSPEQLQSAYNSAGFDIPYEEALKQAGGEQQLKQILQNEGITFNQELQTSSNGTVSKLVSIPNNIKGGQCGHFVNQLTGLGVGDSYASKMAKMDPNIKQPEPGMIFTMPYRDTGHIGFIVSINGDKALVKDSNYFTSTAPETVKTHEIPISKMTGFRMV